MKNCPHCGNVVSDNAAFCNACGKPLSAAPAEVFCPTCGEKISGGGGFCPNCGTTLNAPRKPAPKKKSKSPRSKRSLGLIAAAAAVVALVVLIIAVVPSLFSSSASTFVSTQADFVADRLAAVETVTEQVKKGFSSDLTISAEVDNDEIQEYLDGTSIVLKVDATQESLLTAVEAVFMGSPVLSGTVTLDKEQVGIYAPDLDDTYYVMDLAAILELADIDDIDMDAVNSLEGVELPIAETEELLNKYIKILSGAITKDNLTVEKNQTVKYGELSGKTEKCTVYTFEPTAEEIEEVLLQVAEELEGDKKLRKLFEDLFENEVIAQYLEDYAFDDDPMDVIEEALDTIVEGLEDNAADIGEAIEDMGFVWTMAVKGKDVLLIEIEIKEYEEVYAYEYKATDDKVEEIVYASSYDTVDFCISNKYKIDGKVYDGKIAYDDGWDAYEISYEIEPEKVSTLGLPCGEYEFSLDYMELKLEVTEADKGFDHTVTIEGEDLYYETDGMISKVQVTVNATDKSSAKKPSGTKEDISDYDEDELYELVMSFSDELQELVMDQFGDLFGVSVEPDYEIYPDAPSEW